MKALQMSAAVLLLLVSVADAQTTGSNTPVVAPTDSISFDRPESWALKYFASATLVSGLETPITREPGSVVIGFELGWLPNLDATQRRVGFDGTKTEDLNKAPVLPRPRVTIGLPGRFSLIAAFVPPIESFGLKPKLFALAVERPLYEAEAWSVGLRGYGQFGNVQGAYTCPQGVLPFPPGSPNNSYGCQAVSSDTATLRYAGVELSTAYRFASLGGLSPHAAVGINYMDVSFQVNALTFGYLDHTLLLSHGTTLSVSGGVTYPLTHRLNTSLDVFYTPLSVQRTFNAPDTNDGFFNVRLLVNYRVH